MILIYAALLLANIYMMFSGRLEYGFAWIGTLILIALVYWEWQSYQNSIATDMMNQMFTSLIKSREKENNCGRDKVEEQDDNVVLQRVRQDEIDDSDIVEPKKS